MNKCSKLFLLPVLCTLSLCGCTQQTSSDSTADSDFDVSIQVTEAIESTEPDSVAELSTEDAADNEADTTYVPEILHFVDVYGEEYEVEINPNVPKHTYQPEYFSRDGELLSYEDDAYTSQLGIDVSHYQGNIDWSQVKSDGYEFAFIRLGYRGYVTGEICLDRNFYQNIENAQSCGMDVGVYFFSQAISEEEAIEEANFVIQALSEYNLQLPVVYDPESILDDESRTDNISGEQFTKNTIAFCQTIQDAGFKPMIYCNMLWEAYELDLTQLTDYPIWYADYESLPQTPYYFTFWQYSETGTVAGIDAATDLNIRFIPKEEK